jgi:hypothetical protein
MIGPNPISLAATAMRSDAGTVVVDQGVARCVFVLGGFGQ